MLITQFTAIDWLIIAVLLSSVAISWFSGFVREMISMASVLVGVILAAWFARPVGALFKEVVLTENIALFLGFSLIFLVTLLAGAVCAWLVTRFVKFAKLVWADRLLGAAFGLIRGWMICAAALLALTAFEIQTERLKNSGLAPYFLPGSRVIAVMTPYEIKAKFLVGYRAMERWWRQQ